MKQGLPLFASLLLTGCAQAQNPTENPSENLRVEAEANTPSGDIQKHDTPEASGGQAVSTARAWAPLLRVAPPTQGQAWTLWVRHARASVLVKARHGRKSSDLKWIYAKPASLQWTNAGRYTREQIGEQLEVVRGGGGGQGPLLDCIEWSPNGAPPQDAPAPQTAEKPPSPAKPELPSNQPDPNAPPLRLGAKVEWDKIVGEAKPELWGINDYEILNPAKAADTEYQAFLTSLKPALVRIHRSSISDSWTNAETKTWDIEKIKAGFAASTGFGNAKILVNIARVPKWMAPERVLTPAQEDEFARLMGDLVGQMKAANIPVAYWELTNEWDTAYEKAGKLSDLWRAYNKIAVEVRKADPAARIGGPALTYPNAERVNGFFRNCAHNADFVSWHNYASGKPTTPNAQVLDRPDTLATAAKLVLDAAKEHAPNRKFEFFLTEYNVQWTWEPLEARHGNNIGALFHASTLRRMSLLGVDGVTLWHAKGDAYGLIDGKNRVRLSGEFYRLGREYLVGQTAQGQSDDEKALELWPVVRQGGKRALLLLNKTDRTINIPKGSALLPNARAFRLDANGLAPKIETTGDDLSLPGYSLTLLVEQP